MQYKSLKLVGLNQKVFILELQGQIQDLKKR